MNITAFEKLVICVIHYPPWSSINCSKTGQLLTKSGIVFDFFSGFTSYQNFSHEFRCISHTGSKHLPNGSWTGTLGLIYREECHMILLPYGVFYHRLEYFNHSSPFITGPILMISGGPTSNSRSAAEQFFRANPVVLFSILLGLFLLSVILGIIEKISNPTSTSSVFDYLCGMVSDLLALFDDPNDILIWFKSFQSKLILALWRFAILIIQIHLGASMNAELAIAKTYLIDDYRDVLDQPNLQPLMYNNSLHQVYFKNAETVEERQLWRQVQRTKGLIMRNKLKDYRHDISRGKSVFIGDSINFVSALPLLCRDTKPEPRLYVSTRPRTWLSKAFIVSRSFPKTLFQKINVAIRRFVEFSHIEHVIERRFSEFSFCFWKSSDSGFNTLEKNKNVNFLAYLWSTAISISTFTFVMEMLVFHFKGMLRIISCLMLATIYIFFWYQFAPT